MSDSNPEGMQWKHPPVTKIYEALGAVADGRVKVVGNAAKVLSSSGNKSYAVEYDPSSKSIMVNDNASFYRGYLGYPGVHPYVETVSAVVKVDVFVKYSASNSAGVL